MPQLIENWSDLSKVPDSETHQLKISWIHKKGKENALRAIKRMGFDIEIKNWDEK